MTPENKAVLAAVALRDAMAELGQTTLLITDEDLHPDQPMALVATLVPDVAEPIKDAAREDLGTFKCEGCHKELPLSEFGDQDADGIDLCKSCWEALLAETAAIRLITRGPDRPKPQVPATGRCPAPKGHADLGATE